MRACGQRFRLQKVRWALQQNSTKQQEEQQLRQAWGQAGLTRVGMRNAQQRQPTTAINDNVDNGITMGHNKQRASNTKKRASGAFPSQSP